MKKSDWAAIVLIIALVGLVSYFAVGSLMPSPKNNKQKVKVVPEITDSVVKPSSRIFNDTAINPTVKTTIGNQDPSQLPFTLGSD